MSETREDVTLALERMRAALAFVAEHLTTDEGNAGETEEAFGLDVSEVVEMAHDNMIISARGVLHDATVRKVLIGRGMKQ